MITENVLKEWYTENASRRFPLSVTSPNDGNVPTGLDDEGKTLPNSLLVGLQMFVPRSMLATREAGSTLPYDSLANQYRVYISSVAITLSRVEIVFSTVSGSDIARAVWTPTSEMTGLPVHGVAIAPLATDDVNIGSTKISGFVFLGPDSMWAPHAGVYTFTGGNIYNSMVSESCISCDDDGRITGLVVNGTPLTGEIELVAGDNARLEATGNELHVSFAGDASDGITSRDELIQAIAQLYGQPVIAINGAYPDGNGDFTVSCPDGSMSVTSLGHGLAILSLKGSECCDKSALMGMASNIQELNVKEGRLETLFKAMEGVVNALQNELAYLKLSANQ